jgi:hypothetical protein
VIARQKDDPMKVLFLLAVFVLLLWLLARPRKKP